MIRWLFKNKSIETKDVSIEIERIKDELTILKDKYKRLLEISSLEDLDRILVTFESRRRGVAASEYKIAQYFQERFDGPFNKLVTSLRDGLQKDQAKMYEYILTLSNKVEKLDNRISKIIVNNKLEC